MGETQRFTAATQAPTTAAERMRAYRFRRRSGARRVTVLLYPSEIDALVRKGYVSEGSRHDREALQEGVHELIARALGLPAIPPEVR